MSVRRRAVFVVALGTTTVLTCLVGAALAAPTHSHRTTCPTKRPGVVYGHRHHGETHVVACVSGTRKADGTVTVSSTRSTKRDYVIYQGKPGNVTPHGYIGVDRQHGLTLVGCDTGTYNPDASDEWNQSPHSPNNNAQIAVGTDEFTAPTGPVGPGDPCSPFVPHTPPGKSCGSARTTHPATTAPKQSPLKAYSAKSPGSTVRSGSGQAGITGDFGGGDGASGYLQVTYKRGHGGNVATGGNSRGGGGTVAVGNDGNETDDPFTPKQSPVVVCQD